MIKREKGKNEKQAISKTGQKSDVGLDLSCNKSVKLTSVKMPVSFLKNQKDSTEFLKRSCASPAPHRQGGDTGH